jgi:DNA segregation ATPase FtsK/SpoIIIE, S-DNA-T family
MKTSDLVGKVAVCYLRDQLETLADDTGGTARFILDCLTADQTAAIARAILDDELLNQQVEIRLPAHFLETQGLPSAILTEQRATHFRNAVCVKPVLLVANTGDDEQQSLKELVPIGAAQLQDCPDLWVSVGAEGLPLTQEHRNWWQKALSGLRELRILSLDRLAEYVLRTRAGIESDGEPVIVALGKALPALRIPRDSAYFNALNEKTRNQASRWRKLYDTAQKKRACFLVKQTSSQAPLTTDDLLVTFEKVKDSIPEALHDLVREFIASPAGWNPQSANLSECEWEAVAPLFDGFKREPFNLGQATLDFYEERQADLLQNAEREYLTRLIKRKTTSSDDDEDRKFYDDHRQELKEDRKLKLTWDRFIFGKPFETEDFFSGIVLCIERLFSQQTPAVGRTLRIRCERGTKKELRDLNVDAGLFFACRYRGLRSLLGNRVHWEVGHLFEFDQLVETWRGSKKAVNYSAARAALQLKFVVELELQIDKSRLETCSAQMVWKFDPNAVVAGFQQDWLRLREHPLVLCSAHRKPLNTKGQFQTVDLSNILTFVPAFGKERGTFVGVYRRVSDIAVAWSQNLNDARRHNFISEEVREKLERKFLAFQKSYSEAIGGFLDVGLVSKELLLQLDQYSALLELVIQEASGDRNRELLARPLLQIGVIDVSGGHPTAIVAPWNPLRMAAIAMKAQLVANLVRRLLCTEPVEFGDSRLYFRDLRETLNHPFYPEVALGWQENQPTLLCHTDVVGDYTLHEPPLANQDGLDDTNENPAEGASCVVDLVNRYLTLQPHEHANLSIVLYNCDSSRLPQAVVEKLATLDEDEEEVRCQIILRHRDAKRLRGLYEKIIGSSDNDPDAFSASEATRDFMARLRIGIMADQAPIPANDDIRPADMVFSQDVIARHARLEWYSEKAEAVSISDLVPPHWSRRRPAAVDDLKSVVYLCSPAQTTQGWTYMSALATFFKGNWDSDREIRWLPARQLDFRDTITARIFEETHNLANWVINYDELLDRRQLLNQNVRVIRYKQSVTQGRNVVISSKAPLGLLRAMVLSRLRALNLELQESDYQTLAEKFLGDAKEISGDIVLRAAKHGRNASELLGVVLSRYLVRFELGKEQLFGWYFLDDYSDWLGQREEQIADVLALNPQCRKDGKLQLAAVVTEAKYIDAASLGPKRKESQKQLRDTVKRINDAVFGNPERLDRALWLSRLSDLILDGVQLPASSRLNLSDWRRAVRDGTCDILVRGYSHIFVSGPSDAETSSDVGAVAGLENAYQEVFGRRDLRQLVLRYFRDDDPTSIREEIAGDRAWLVQKYQTPSEVRAITASTPPTASEPELEDDRTTPKHGGGIREGVAVSEESTLAVSMLSSDRKKDMRWAYPAISGLLSHDGRHTGDGEPGVGGNWLREIESKTKGALQQFQLQSKLVHSLLTPNAGLLKFAGSSNLTVEQVLKRRSEFLTTHGINIISVLPEPGLVSIAVERPHRQLVRVQDVWNRWKPDSTRGNQELIVGVREDNGELLIISPGRLHAPHTLIAGSTGSGKSVLMQDLILGIAATNTPSLARIVLIDPKQGVDYAQFEDLPHVEGGIIDDRAVALDRLRELVVEMDHRYTRLKASRTNSLSAYNQAASEGDRLPVIWVIHDEFAEWMLVEDYKQEVTALVSRLGVKARAAGIYLIFAAQRPDANVMPMQLRANLGNRLILRVDSEGTSEIALGDKGAERLLGKGHLVARLEGVPLCYAQVPFVEMGFIDHIIAAIRSGSSADHVRA